MMRLFKCEWAIEVLADDAVAAAQQAAGLAGDSGGSWLVIDEDRQKAEIVDLREQEPTIAEAYVAGGGLFCPSCKSPNIVGGTVEVDGSQAILAVDCSDCAATWTDVYVLSNIVDLEVPQ